ncbi:MAG TPA: hypothetical protein VM186_04075, partial [Planctomycetota bacterium]|nr:hypothetical protein [Planctomycetota bacterium]
MSWTRRLTGDSKTAAMGEKPEQPRAERDNRAPEAQTVTAPDDSFEEMKSRIHKKLIDALDLSKLESAGRDELRSQVGLVVDDLLSLEGAVLRRAERDRLIEQILD